jgi:hypothetical protein
MNAHGEGLLAGPSIASFCDARAHAQAHGLDVESIFVLDRAQSLTRATIAAATVPDVTIYETDFGDPGSSRNFGASKATGDFVAYLDADDLWSENWLTAATRFCQAQPERIVAQSEVNVVFGDVHNLWIHADSAAPDFDISYLAVGNYWDAMVFTWRDIMLEFPIQPNDLKRGYGHEDWHWNCRTLLAGLHHRPVPDTVHFKRRRGGSQMAKCADSDVIIYHSEIYAESRKHLAPQVPPCAGGLRYGESALTADR